MIKIIKKLFGEIWFCSMFHMLYGTKDNKWYCEKCNITHERTISDYYCGPN